MASRVCPCRELDPSSSFMRVLCLASSSVFLCLGLDRLFPVCPSVRLVETIAKVLPDCSKGIGEGRQKECAQSCKQLGNGRDDSMCVGVEGKGGKRRSFAIDFC